MSKIRVKLNSAEVRSQLLKSGAVAGMCKGIASEMASRAGNGYAVREVNYPERTGAIVYPETQGAARDNYRNNTLEKVRSLKYND